MTYSRKYKCMLIMGVIVDMKSFQVRRGICVITYLKKQTAFGCRKHNIGPVNRRIRIIKFIKR